MTDDPSPQSPPLPTLRPRCAKIAQGFRRCGVARLLIAGAVGVVSTFAMATPAAASASVLYDGSSQLAAGQIPFPYQSFIAGHVTVVPDPLGGNFNVMKFAIPDSDRPYSGASNPRADFETSGYFSNGSDLYYSLKFLIPAGFPVLTSSGFFQISEVYGPPHGGSPPIGIDLFPGAGGRPVVSLQRDANYGYDRPWTSPVSLDTGWHTIYVHTRSASDNTGFVQVWFDGQPQTMTNGTQTVSYPTLASGINWDGSTPNVLNVNQYRKAYAYPGVVTTYHAAAKIGTTLADVVDGAVGLSPPPPLQAAFTGPATSTIGQAVTFNSSTSTGTPTSYKWTDAAANNTVLGTGPTLNFTFHYAGTKKITLTETDASGAKSTVEHNLTVS